MARPPRKRHARESWVDHHRLNIHYQYPVQFSAVPPALVRGLIRGLLRYYSQPARRRRADEQGLDWMEDGLMELLDCLAAERTEDARTPANTRQIEHASREEVVNRYASRVTQTLNTLLRHPHPRALAIESDWLDPQLAPYGKLHSEQCVSWLRKNLPNLLGELLDRSRCGLLSCPRTTTVPDDIELKKWAFRKDTITPNTPTRIRHHILAHFHGSTFQTVKHTSSLPLLTDLSSSLIPFSPSL